MSLVSCLRVFLSSCLLVSCLLVFMSFCSCLLSLQHNTKDRTKDKPNGKKDRGYDEDTALPEGQGTTAEERKHTFHLVVVDRAPVGEDGKPSGELDQVDKMTVSK